MGSSPGTAETVRAADDRPGFPDRPARRTIRYDVRGVSLIVASDVADALDLIDATYAAFRIAAPAEPPETDDRSASQVDPLGVATFRLTSLGEGGPCRIELPGGRTGIAATPGDGAIALLEGMVGSVVAGLHRQGLFAIHAGAVAGPAGAVIVAGRSGQGKSTLVLGLARRGWALLSDELALLDPSERLVHPYPRAIHVRPATVDLIPELAPLEARPLVTLGGGNEWSVAPADVARLLGARLGEAAPLAAVVLLEGRPDPHAQPRIRDEFPAVAAIELLRSTWATSADFAGTLDAVGGMLSSVPCYRLAVGAFEPTIAALVGRLGAGDG